MDKVFEKLNRYYNSDDGKPYLNSSKYDIFDYSFNSIVPKISNIYFIDGGNQEIIVNNSFSVGFNKVAYAHFKDKKENVVVQHFWSTVFLNKDMKYESSFNNTSLEFDAYDSSLEVSGNRVTPTKINNLLRKINELILAKQLSDKVKNSIIVLDGILLANVNILKKYFDELYLSAKKNNNIICSLAKNSNLVTTTGKSLPDLLIHKKEGAFAYKLAKSKFDEHNAIIYLVKLHNKSDYVFRFEIGREWEDEAIDVLGALANNSRDPVFLGYPYGMVLADELARVSNNETEFFKTKLSVELSKKNINLTKSLFKKSAHGVLDNIKF